MILRIGLPKLKSDEVSNVLDSLKIFSPAGSWLIQTLCDEINSSSPSDEFLGILTRVLRRVATQK